ncbi:MAG: M3 family metallopeptidase, partial [Gammaproteobacteria bacterium]
MAGSVDEVIGFLRDLARRSKPYAERNLAELGEHAGRRLEPWDIAFYSERLREQRFALSDEELRRYFPLPKVLAGLFSLAENLFGIEIARKPAESVWHPSVEYYEVRRRGVVTGGFFTDLYARPQKRGGAWMDGCRDRARLSRLRQDPVAYLVCNFAPPTGDTPSLLTHGEVVTLFHEFGHGLHHLLTEVDYPSLAGINGVAWDAVELPSQFLENYAWRPEVLKTISGEYRTGEPLPDEKIEKLNGSRTFMEGLATVRQLEFALFDFLLHSRDAPPDLAGVYALLDDVRREVAVVKPPEYNRFPCTFSHIFGGGYAAGYYSYKWAEVLAADAFAAFEETGVLDAATAERFRREILAVGGSRPALDAFVAFRGREPDIDALLRQAGMVETAAA